MSAMSSFVDFGGLDPLFGVIILIDVKVWGEARCVFCFWDPVFFQ